METGWTACLSEGWVAGSADAAVKAAQAATGQCAASLPFDCEVQYDIKQRVEAVSGQACLTSIPEGYLQAATTDVCIRQHSFGGPGPGFKVDLHGKVSAVGRRSGSIKALVWIDADRSCNEQPAIVEAAAHFLLQACMQELISVPRV